MFVLNFGLYAKMQQNDAYRNDLVSAAAPAQKIKRQLARAEGAREKNLAFLRLQKCVLP